jgi:arabinosyltransferase C
VLGGGFGFLLWHRFGEAITLHAPEWIAGALAGRLPIDVWQPEAFVFPSMLVNGLFMAALCLILVIFGAVLDARESWKPVPGGFLAMLALMNVHSYDVLLLALVFAAFLATCAARRTLSGPWLVRGLVIGSGAAPSAAWFLYVIRSDPVFQARAATETYSPGFRSLAAGLSLLIALAIAGLALDSRSEQLRPARLAMAAVPAVAVVGLCVIARTHMEGYWLDWSGWIALYAGAVVLSALLSRGAPASDLIVCWALAGLTTPYFPMLFQRKLAMGLAIPWAILAASGVFAMLRAQDKGRRILVGTLAVVVLAGSSLRWLFREFEFIRLNVSRTTVHPVYFPQETRRILEALRAAPGRKVVLAMPGIPIQQIENGRPAPDSFQTPYIADLNALASGYAGAYSFAGHWSETPDYATRRRLAQGFFLGDTPEESKRALLETCEATHIIAPVPEALPEFFGMTGHPLQDFRGWGRVMVEGAQFRLIELPRAGP